MVPSLGGTIHRCAVLIGSAAGAGLLFFGSWAGSLQAQLGQCSSLQQQQHSARCERPGISSGSSLDHSGPCGVD